MDKERIRMDLEVGEILEGKVTGITKFGAFVQFPDGSSGLVHISEIANAYVNDVNDYLSMGQTVKVKVIGINEAGKINLSIKQTLPSAPRPSGNARYGQQPRSPQPSGYVPAARPSSRPAVAEGELIGPSGDASFEDKLKHFMQESDSKMSGSKLYSDRRGGNRRRK